MGIFSRVRAANEVIESAKKEIDRRHQNDEVARKREQKAQGKR
jgi:hypothetical protein